MALTNEHREKLLRAFKDPSSPAYAEWEGFFGHKNSWFFTQFLLRTESIIALFTGNQKGKTADVAKAIAMMIMGIHPIEKKNIRPDTKIRTIRVAAETLPNDPDGGEAKNTQYPALKKVIPPSLIKKDITIRKPVMAIHDIQGGPDIYLEFVSYNQSTQSQAGVQRWLVWCDESSPQAFYEEQLPRLIAADGSLIYTLTPAEHMGWEFDEIFEKAKIYIRTKSVRERIRNRMNKEVGVTETTDSTDDIAVLMAASDDNPYYQDLVDTINKKEKKNYTVTTYLDHKYSHYHDEDVIDIRRYGLFKQVSGQIFKDYDGRFHVIRPDNYFPNGFIPNEWRKARLIDYHEHVPWAIVYIALSPNDEAFVFNELNPSPEKMITMAIAKRMAEISYDYRFHLNLIDPLAGKKQPNTGLSTIDDLNSYFMEFKKQGLGTGGYWEPWDTKSTRGRDEIRKRLKNAKLCGKPFNNVVTTDGRTQVLPTIWIFDHCVQTALSMKNWRIEEWADREALVTKEAKDTPQQKWSHFNMCIEAVFKHEAFRPIKKQFNPLPNVAIGSKYFQGRNK